MRKFNIKVNGISYNVEVEELAADAQFAAPIPAAPAPVAAAPVAAPAAAPPAAAPAPAAAAEAKPAPSGSAGSVKITSPMPGTIISINVKVGQEVKTNEVLCILEAMKMENEIVSTSDGTVVSIDLQEGSAVAAGDLIMTLS